MAHRFHGICIASVTIINYEELLPESLVLQVIDFLPPSGSFDDVCLQRYLQNLKNFEEETKWTHVLSARLVPIARVF